MDPATDRVLVVNSAIGGSTNAPIHFNAIARHVGVKLDNDDWEKIGYDIPLLVNLQPIPDVVLAETIWTLKGKRYKASKDDLVAMVMGLLEEPNIVFESRQAVWSAVNDYIKAPPVKTADGVRTADLADALVVNKAKVTAQRRAERYGGTYTYDQAALALAGTKQP